MSIKFIGKRSVLYTLSKIISAVLSLLSISLFTRIFDADTYGQYLLFVSKSEIYICIFSTPWTEIYKQIYLLRRGEQIYLFKVRKEILSNITNIINTNIPEYDKFVSTFPFVDTDEGTSAI